MNLPNRIRTAFQLVPVRRFYFMGKHFVKDQWKPLSFCNGKYQISRFGKVKSVYTISKYGKIRFTGTILKTTINRKGYEKARISWIENGKTIKKTMAVHRLVAMAWIPNVDNKPQINHIDCNPLNNDFRNLEWCTPQENVHHAQRMGRMPTKKPVVKKGYWSGIEIINIETGDKYKNLESLCELYRLNPKNIRRQISGERYCYVPYRYLGRENDVKFAPVKPPKPIKIPFVRPPKKEYVPHPIIPKKIKMFDINGNELRTFDSAMMAAEFVKSTYDTFRRAIKKSPNNFTKGYIWKYA